jgi:hypothetical protein
MLKMIFAALIGAAAMQASPLPALAQTATLASPHSDTGSESLPSFAAGPQVPVLAGGVLPSTGSEGGVESANSLPRGFAQGTASFAYRQSVARYFAERAVRTPARLAQR